MLDIVKAKITGHILIKYSDTGEVLLDTHNDVLYGNISSALAYSLLGNSNSFLAYIAFGNGGAYVSPTGTISYKPSLGGAASLLKNPLANLYNTIFAKKLTSSTVYVPTTVNTTNYEDLVVDVTLSYSEPPTSLVSNAIQQAAIDNSTFIGSSTSNTTGITSLSPNEFVFNELGLFAGTTDLFSGSFTETTTDVDNFVAQGPNYSTTTGAKSKLMLTHAIFHPVQKAANRSIEIIYTLRIQMGAA